MGVDFYPCHGTCKGTYCDAGEYTLCYVCQKGACRRCGAAWDSIDSDDLPLQSGGRLPQVCPTCKSIEIPDHDIFAALLQLYQQLPGADLTLTYETLEHKLSEHKESKYTQWKRKHYIVTRSDDEHSEDDQDEGDAAAPAKRHCPSHAGQPETLDE